MLEFGLAVLVLGVGFALYKRGKKNDGKNQGSVPRSGGGSGGPGRETQEK